MKTFPEKQIIDKYLEGNSSLRGLAKDFNTDHHTIKRILLRHDVKITKSNFVREFSEQHCQRISQSRRTLYQEGKIVTWSKGKKMSVECCLKNMLAHLRYNVTLEWLRSFSDMEKLKYLNRSISRRRDCSLSTEEYIDFINKFYFDSKFNNLYEKWIQTKDKWIKPSLDHITPKSSNGKLSIHNMRFISWLENRAKADISLDIWDKMKDNISWYL